MEYLGWVAILATEVVGVSYGCGVWGVAVVAVEARPLQLLLLAGSDGLSVKAIYFSAVHTPKHAPKHGPKTQHTTDTNGTTPLGSSCELHICIPDGCLS